MSAPLSAHHLQEFLNAEFPGFKSRIVSASPNHCELIRLVSTSDLRPGGTVSGPTMMELADTALYVAVLATIGLVPLAVTTNLTINFLRKPAANRDLRAACDLHKVGKTQAMGSVAIYSLGDDDMVAHVVGTYAIPLQR